MEAMGATLARSHIRQQCCPCCGCGACSIELLSQFKPSDTKDAEPAAIPDCTKSDPAVVLRPNKKEGAISPDINPGRSSMTGPATKHLTNRRGFLKIAAAGTAAALSRSLPAGA